MYMTALFRTLRLLRHDFGFTGELGSDKEYEVIRYTIKLYNFNFNSLLEAPMFLY